MKNQKIKIQEVIISFVVSLLIVFGVTLILGTLTSGWHFIDDHEFIYYDYYKRIEHWSNSKLFKEILLYDLQTRNTFLYYPFRIIVFLLVGADPLRLAIVKALETAIAMTLLYLCGRKISGSAFAGALFSLISLVGYQSAIWWKSGPPHVQATICFGIAFLCLLTWLDDTSKTIFAILSCIFATAMGYFHESFLMLIPFLAFYVIYDSYKKKAGIPGSKKPILGILGAIKTCDKKRAIFFYILIIDFVANILEIIIRLGFNSYPAVGINSSFSPVTYLKVIVNNFSFDLKWYWKVGVFLVCILLTYFDSFKKYWPEMLLSGLIIAMQLVLYSKEGISERYVIPLSIGFSMFFCIFMLSSDILSGFRKKLYIVALFVLLAIHAHVLIVEGDYYRFRGESVTNALEQIESLSNKGYKVMTCFGNANPEAEFTVDSYCKSKGIDEIYYWDQNNSAVLDIPAFYRSQASGSFKLDEIDVVLAYNRNDRHFEVDPNFDLSDFTLVRTGSIDIFFRNDAENEVTDELVDQLHVKPTIYGIGN